MIGFLLSLEVVADIVVLDSKHDLALLKVNSGALKGVLPLALLAPDPDSTIRVGIPVVAFGSPLSQTFLMTLGIVSKVEPSVLRAWTANDQRDPTGLTS